MWKCEVCRVRCKAQQWKTPGPTGMGELNTMEDCGEREWGVSSTDEDVPMIQNLREGEGVGVGALLCKLSAICTHPLPSCPNSWQHMLTWNIIQADNLVHEGCGHNDFIKHWHATPWSVHRVNNYTIILISIGLHRHNLHCLPTPSNLLTHLQITWFMRDVDTMIGPLGVTLVYN